MLRFFIPDWKLVQILLSKRALYRTDPKYLDRSVWANSADPYQLCNAVCIFWMHFSTIKPCSNFWVITANFLGVQIFGIFTVLWIHWSIWTDPCENGKGLAILHICWVSPVFAVYMHNIRMELAASKSHISGLIRQLPMLHVFVFFFVFFFNDTAHMLFLCHLKWFLLHLVVLE